MWLLRGLRYRTLRDMCGCYVGLRGSYRTLLPDMRHGSCYRVYDATTTILPRRCRIYGVHKLATYHPEYTWLLRALRGNYRIYMAVTGSTWQLPKWMGRGFLVAFTGSIRGNYRMCVAVTGSTMQLPDVHGCYGILLEGCLVTATDIP